MYGDLGNPPTTGLLHSADYTTIDTDEDIRLNDAIRRDLIGEGLLLHYNDAHKWYYFKDQGVNDLIVFRNSIRMGNERVSGPLQTCLPRYNVSSMLFVVYSVNTICRWFPCCCFESASKGAAPRKCRSQIGGVLLRCILRIPSYYKCE